jgi:hypothetical protein
MHTKGPNRNAEWVEGVPYQTTHTRSLKDVA